MSTENKAIATRFFVEVCNARMLHTADEIFTQDHPHHDPSSPGIGRGPEGMKQLVTTYQRAFPDAHWAVDEMFTAGDTVITRWTGTGTHNGDLSGIAPTGKRVTVAGIWIQRISGGKITESWNVWDTLGMMQQLGVVPALAQAGGKSAKQAG